MLTTGNDSLENGGKKMVNSDWYDKAWGCRKSHVIQSSPGAGNGYQVKIMVNYNSGSDSGNIVNMNGFCKTDFTDIRFTSDDGTTLLPYYMESVSTATQATFWVKVSGDLSSTNQTIFVYYNNPSATSEGNQFTTGIVQLREHKVVPSYNPDITFSIDQSTWLKMSSPLNGLGFGWAFMVVPKSWINGKYLRWSWKGDWNYFEDSYEWCVRIYDGVYLRSNTADFPYNWPLTKGAGLLYNCDKTFNYTWGPDLQDHYIDVSAAQNEYVTIFLLLRDAWIANWMNGCWDYIEINQSSGGNGNISRIHFDTAVVMEQTGTTSDYGLVRKYVNQEPQHGDWGSIEISNFSRLTGYGSKNTVISSSGDKPIIIVNRPDYNEEIDELESPLIENIILQGNGTNTGILINGTCHCQIRNVSINNCNIGIHLKNSTNRWTELTNITHVRISNVNKGIYFENTNGDQNSFAYTHIEDVGILLNNAANCIGIDLEPKIETQANKEYNNITTYSSFIKANIWLQYSDSIGVYLRKIGTYETGNSSLGGMALVNLYVSKLGSTGGTGLKVDFNISSPIKNNQDFFLATNNLSTNVYPSNLNDNDKIRVRPVT